MRYLKAGVAAPIELQATLVAAGDADPSAGVIACAIRKWKQGDAEDGYYYTGAAWQAGAATVNSVQGDNHAHVVTVDATRMAGLAGFGLTVRPASATEIGATVHCHVLDDFVSKSSDTLDTGITAAVAGIESNGDTLDTLPTAAEVDTELSSAHGSGSWEGTLTGASQVTITVTDGVDPLEGVQVDVYDSGNTTILRQGFTDVAGEVTFAIDDGSYKVRLSLSLYAFTVPEDLTVSGNTADTYTGATLVSIDPPAGANLCRIFGTMVDAAGNAVAGATVEAMAGVPQVVAGKHLGDPSTSTTTNASGAFTLDLERTSRVRFRCERAAVDAVLTVPDATTQDWATWNS